MPEVVLLGETLVVFDSQRCVPLRYATNYECHTGGAETNVAVGLIRLGHSAGWISRLGDDEFGKMLYNVYRGEGVDVSQVTFDKNHPTGIFFRQPTGSGSYQNFYYRSNSACTAMTPEMLDEAYIASAKYLHVSGVTLAVSDSMAKTAQRAMEIAKENKVTVAFDANLRMKMWTAAQARETIDRILHLTDVAFCGIEEGEVLFGTTDPDAQAEALQNYGIHTVIIKVGKDGAIGYEDGQKIVSPTLQVKQIVDKFGAGDAFAAGFIAGKLKGFDFTNCLKLANSVGALSITSAGNIEALPTFESVKRAWEGTEEVAR